MCRSARRLFIFLFIGLLRLFRPHSRSRALGLHQKMDALRGLTEDDIYAEILNASGPQPSVLFCEPAFISLVKRQIRRFESPGMGFAMEAREEGDTAARARMLTVAPLPFTVSGIQCIDLVHEELQKVLRDCLHMPVGALNTTGLLPHQSSSLKPRPGAHFSRPLGSAPLSRAACAHL